MQQAATALAAAARHNQAAVSLYSTPVQPGAWQGCQMSPWCVLAVVLMR
jgi:hypothetical protein